MATEKSGMSLVTMLPAPIVQPLPMVTPGMMVVFPPIQQSSPMTTGLAYSMPSRRDCTSVSWVAAKIDTKGPNCTRFPIVTKAQSKMTRLIRGRAKIEIRIEIIPDPDITTVVQVDRWFYERSGPDLAHDALQHGLPVLREGLQRGVVREVRVVLVHEAPRLEAARQQLRCLRIVSW
ncbi:hypothetical protein GGS21DRAFT_176261 [Xylaria nigripes]|nr:hypothetical protein GGS21DRAFT_176261 [Xylaria nigripes]